MLKTSSFCVWTFLFLFVLPVSASAQLEFEIGPEVYYFKYEEPGMMKESGIMSGVAGSLKHKHKNRMIALEGRFAAGTVDYSSKDTGNISNVDDYTTEWRILGGQSFRLTEDSIITPYIGWGFRKIQDNLAGRRSTTGHFGYKRESSYQYSPLGIKVDSELGEGWFLGTTIEYDFFWRGKQKSQRGEINSRYKNITNIQEEGHGARVSINLTRKFQDFSLGIKAFIRSWFVENSNLADSGAGGWQKEPGNITFEIGTAVSIGF